MQKKCNYLSQKVYKTKDNLTDMEKKVQQLTQHLEENVLKQKVLAQEKDQAGAHFIVQEKNMQAKICALQEEKNEMKVGGGPGARPFRGSRTVTPLGSLWLQTSLRKTQEELEESLKKQSVSEGAAEVSKRYQLELEEERFRLARDLDALRQKVGAAVHPEFSAVGGTLTERSGRALCFWFSDRKRQAGEQGPKGGEESGGTQASSRDDEKHRAAKRKRKVT